MSERHCIQNACVSSAKRTALIGRENTGLLREDNLLIVSEAVMGANSTESAIKFTNFMSR
jgi:hypothetical protein